MHASTQLSDVHDSTKRVAVAPNAHTLLTGGADGTVVQHDLRQQKPSCVAWQCRSAVTGLVLEYPWLAISEQGG